MQEICSELSFALFFSMIEFYLYRSEICPIFKKDLTV
jgi:hypothetical protein